MPALLKVYTDSGHTTEVAHTAQNSTTTAGVTQGIGTTILQVTSTTGMPAQGVIDIDPTGSLETIGYTSVQDATHLVLAKATTISHATPVAVVQWYYQLAVGDQTNGIINDGTDATPNGLGVNVATWYFYNAGDQTAQNIVLTTASAAPSTTSGFADTFISVTSVSTGFLASVTPSNLVAGATAVQFWVAAEIPSGQSGVGNPQICNININYQSI